MAKKLVAVAYSAKMAYYVSYCFLTYLPILGDEYVKKVKNKRKIQKELEFTWTLELKPTCPHVIIMFLSIIKDTSV